MKKINNTSENPRKNNYFATIVSFDNDNKKKYELAYTSKNYDDCYNFLRDNFASDVYSSVKRYNELLKAGVPAAEMVNFKNPKIY